ncbi:MAG: phospholipid carrier-dependent glycosyltransferase, partial [bacterium]|nr:phospholipid carrier-dependent glycosyltransferase [bacterium]
KIVSLNNFIGSHFTFFSVIGFGSFLTLLWWHLFNCHPQCHFRAIRPRAHGREESGNPCLVIASPKGAGVSLFSRLLRLRQLADPRNGVWITDKVGDNDKGDKKFFKIILLLLLLFTLFSRTFRLDTPPTFYFDEVYHAFTAREMARGNQMAWEWWNSPPEGFAYEWTHPPLAKEAMVLGMKILGENPVGWRIPGVLAGIGSVFLVYFLGKKLFGGKVGLIAAFLFSLDGLSFVQSRIGMNDAYFLFFTLLSFYLFLETLFRDRGKASVYPFLLGVSLGLALASKWTAIYTIGILGGLFMCQLVHQLICRFPSSPADKKLRLHQFIRGTTFLFLTFLVIPLAVYFISYLPFFTSGHDFSQFIELQKQMWWYHTRLSATHGYTSAWYSWPFLVRPVWYYVNYGSSALGGSSQVGQVANIYAMGNPIIWWGGIVAIGSILISLIAKFKVPRPPDLVSTRSRTGRQGGAEGGQGSKFKNMFNVNTQMPNVINGDKVGLGLMTDDAKPMTNNTMAKAIVLLGYFGFFLPWALSPRIMFLYHYLPSVPFMCLALGWGLEKVWKRLRLLTISYLLLTILIFIYFYPHLSALPVPKWLSESYFWFKSWR